MINMRSFIYNIAYDPNVSAIRVTKIITKFSTTVYVKYFQIKKLANPCNEIQKIKHHFEGHICSLISLVRKFVE